MPDVVFEIHGRKYPLPPSAYTSTVGVLGRGSLGSLARLLSPGKSTSCKVAGPRWRMREVHLDELAFLSGALLSSGPTCGRCSLIVGEMGQTESTEPSSLREGGVGRTTVPMGASIHCSSF